MSSPSRSDNRLDVRTVPKPDRHPLIFDRYRELAVGEAFVLTNDHDPRHLREEFEAELPGSYAWEYLNQVDGDWQIKITKLTSTPLPRVLTNTATDTASDAAGVQWKLQMGERDLDSNLIALAPEATIDTHVGPDLDVLIHVVSGSGTLTTEAATFDLWPGDVTWLPRRSVRSFTAGSDGLRYLTVHQRRKALQLDVSALHQR